MRVEPSLYSTPEEIIVGTLSDADDPTTFTPYYTITDATIDEGTWRNYEIELSDYFLTDEYIGIKQASINERQVIFIDDFRYDAIDCVVPTDLGASQTNPDEVTLFWQDNNGSGGANSWEIEYGETGFTQGTGTVITANTNPFALSGLTTFEAYDFYVRANCGTTNGFSNWSEVYTFNVTCAVTAPFYENFDQYDASHPNNVELLLDTFCKW